MSPLHPVCAEVSSHLKPEDFSAIIKSLRALLINILFVFK